MTTGFYRVRATRTIAACDCGWKRIATDEEELRRKVEGHVRGQTTDAHRRYHAEHGIHGSVKRTEVLLVRCKFCQRNSGWEETTAAIEEWEREHAQLPHFRDGRDAREAALRVSRAIRA